MSPFDRSMRIQMLQALIGVSIIARLYRRCTSSDKDGILRAPWLTPSKGSEPKTHKGQELTDANNAAPSVTCLLQKK